MFDAIWKIAVAVIGLIVALFVTAVIIDEIQIKKKVKEAYKEAAAVLIQSKDIKTVRVGIYDDSDVKISEMEISSDAGVSSSIQEGQKIYL